MTGLSEIKNKSMGMEKLDITELIAMAEISSRHEIKGQIESEFQSELETKLRDAGYASPYPARVVNSYYYDSETFELFRQSEEGEVPRVKLRLRSYGDCSSQFNLEVKESLIDGKRKTSMPLKITSLPANLNYKDMKFFPSVCVRFERTYLMKAEIRVTIDTKLQYWDPQSSGRRYMQSDLVVVEVKCESESVASAVLSSINVQRQRFSKYCAGINLLGENRN